MTLPTGDIETTLKLLAATPRRLAAVSNGLGNARLQLKPDANTWSANEILAHLRACTDVWGKSIAAMLGQNQPTLRYISPRTWIRKTDYPDLDFYTSLKAFTQQRKTLLRTLKSLSPTDWSRGAIFTGTTRGRVQTVFSYAWRMAEHERGHCEQIERVLRQI